MDVSPFCKPDVVKILCVAVEFTDDVVVVAADVDCKLAFTGIDVKPSARLSVLESVNERPPKLADNDAAAAFAPVDDAVMELFTATELRPFAILPVTV